ncbi:uncharacterized protein TNCT_336031 [Trichonephila clavata]|uniref:Uncharacterized protein n=1 Tax=Trichonephila clavata TaxID=2740835 RepID=A0A8X6HMX0_TRICU|nr:uncharacterized protein TNCT_336031 [Trichonephila clavata]
MRMRNHKLRDDIDIRRRECSDYEIGTKFYKDREAEVMQRIQSATQATLDLEEEMAQFPTPKTPTPVVVPPAVTPIPVSQPATGSGVFNLSPEVVEAALSERSRTPHSRDDSLGLLDAKQVTRFEDRSGLSKSIDASRSINLPRNASPVPVATQRSPSPNRLDDSLELLHFTRAPSIMEDRLSLSGSIGAYSDSLDSPERVASPVAVASQMPHLREDSPGMLDATRPPTRFEDSLNLSRDLYFSPDSLDSPKRVPSEVPMGNRWLGGPPNEFNSIPQQSETISLSPFAPTEVRSVKTPTGSVKSLIKFSSPGRSVPFNMELEMKPQGIRQSPSGHRVICDVALEMKEAEAPQPRWRNIHLLKHIVRGSPPISETIGRRFDRKHGLFTPRSVIRRDFIGVRRPLFGDFPWVTGRTPPRTPSPIPSPLATTIEWEGTPKE